MFKRTSRGLTVTEVIITVAILGIIYMMTKMGTSFVNSFAKQRVDLEVQMGAQAAMDMMARDIRNAQSITTIDYNKLVLRCFDTDNGYDTAKNPNLFNPVYLTTKTYTYSDPLKSVVLTISDRPGSIRLVKQQVIKPQNPKGEMFTNYSPDPSRLGKTMPLGGYDGVEILLKLQTATGSQRREYRMRVVKRGST